MKLVFNPITENFDYVASTAADVNLSGLATSITTGKTLTLTATGDFNLTIPATGTAALLGVANVFTAIQKINVNSTTAFLVEQDGVKDNVLVVDTTNGIVSAGLTTLVGSFAPKFYTVGGASSVTPGILIQADTQTDGAYLSMATKGAVGGSGGGASLAFYDGTSVGQPAGAFNYAGGNSIGSRYIGFISNRDRDGTKIPLRFFSQDSAGTLITAFRTKPGVIVGMIGTAFGGDDDGQALVGVIGVADKIQLKVKANATQTTNPFELQKSTSAVQISFDDNGGAVFNEAGNGTADFRVESDTEANMIFLDANGDTDGALYFGGSTNGIKISKGGEFTMLGDATVWDDLMVSALATKLGGSKDPGFAKFKDNGSGSQGVFTYWFDAAEEEEIYFNVQMPHSWKGSTIYPHVHWTPRVTADGNPANQTVEWGLEYTWIDIGGDFANTSIVYGKAHTPADANVVAGRHYLTPLTTIAPSATQDGISSMLVCRIFRNSTDTTDDTYEQDAGLLQFDIHYEMDTIGSKTDTAK